MTGFIEILTQLFTWLDSQLPITPFERSRWRGRRFACYTPRVMPQPGVLVQRFRFRVIFATAFNSVNYSHKSIEIP
jgi:hypothetical protein